MYDRVDNNCSSTVRLGHSFARAKLMSFGSRVYGDLQRVAASRDQQFLHEF